MTIAELRALLDALNALKGAEYIPAFTAYMEGVHDVMAAFFAALPSDQTGTSVQSVAIGTGAKSFPLESARSLLAGDYLVINPDDHSEYMVGTLAAATTSSTTFDVTVGGVFNGSGSNAKWLITPIAALVPPPLMVREIDGDDALLSTDRRALLLFNSAAAASFDLLVLAAAGAGFEFEYFNIGAGPVTLGPASSETINRAATLAIRQGEGGRVIATSSGWAVTGRAGEVSRADVLALCLAL